MHELTKQEVTSLMKLIEKEVDSLTEGDEMEENVANYCNIWRKLNILRCQLAKSEAFLERIAIK